MNELERQSFPISMHFGYDWPGRIFMSLAVHLCLEGKETMNCFIYFI